MAIPLKMGNLTGASTLLQEAIKIDSSPEAMNKLFAWLSTSKAAPLRQEIGAKLVYEIRS